MNDNIRVNSPRHARFRDIITQENITQKQTYHSYGKWFVRFEQAIDVLMELCYYDYALPGDQSSSEYEFIISTLDTYYGLSMSFRSCSTLMEKGFYHDSLNCCRSILETLVKYRYLLDHKDQLIAYEKDGNDSNGKKVTLRRAWEYVAGIDSQKKTYHFLSKFEHKNFGSSLPRLNASTNSSKSFSLLPDFNARLAEIVINYLYFLLFGYINFADRFIPYQRPIQQSKFYTEYLEIKTFLHEEIQKKKAIFPTSKAWCEAMEKVIYEK